MRRRPLTALLVAVMAASSLLSVGAVPQPTPIGRFPVAPGIVREVHRTATASGPVVLQLLRFRLDDPTVDLTPELGLGTLPGREPTHRTLRRLGPTAVAAVNGTFRDRYPGPDGQPEGLFVRDRVYYSEPQRIGRQWRNGVALFADRRYEIGAPSYSGVLVQPDGTEVPISAVNRHPAAPRPGFEDETEVTLISPAMGRTTLTPPGTTELVVGGTPLAFDLDVTVRVAGMSTRGNVAIPPDGFVIAASGQLGKRYATALRPGDRIGVRLALDGPAWEQARHAFVAGPLIVRDGQVTPRASWFDEGFGPRHNDQTHPRTVIGFTAGGEVLLVTVDGRQPGYSVGLTTAETAQLMVQLGARDAVMLDGGGSTTMAVDGRVFNRPSDGAPRALSNSLVVRSGVATPQVTRVGGWDRYQTAAAVARTGWPGGTATAVLASGEDFPDALAGGPLAADRGWPLLLTPRDRLSPVTDRALADLKVRRVIILGGPAAVSAPVEQALRARGYATKRIAGADRTQTAARIAWYLPASSRALLASASNWPDALSATVPAAAVEAPVLTTWSNRLSDHVLATLTSRGVREVVVVGGPAAVSERVVAALRSHGYAVTRVAGDDRYGTSVALAEWAKTNALLATTEVAVATGHGFTDALVGGPYAAARGMLVVLTDPLDIDRSAAAGRWLRQQPLTGATIVGGRADVSTWVAHQLDEIAVG